MEKLAVRVLPIVLLSPACKSAPADPTPSPAVIATAIATETPSTSASTSTPVPDPFGLAKPISKYTCPALLAHGSFSPFQVAAADTRAAFVDGDDLLALANRSPQGALAPDYAPRDLVDIYDSRPRTPAECESAHACLRREAAATMHAMLAAMRSDHLLGRVESAFRGFGTQCSVFAHWARDTKGFCSATEQSALPGHSQHQLGTTIDMFTSDWAEQGARAGEGVFRNGFGCARGGRWIADNSWRFGWVLPYPLHPDDRMHGSTCAARGDRRVPINPKTGYKAEPWHVRFVGIDAAARFHEAAAASADVTLEQWLRSQRGLVGDAELPVCDGCQCGACATMARDGDEDSPCKNESLMLDEHGRVLQPEAEPEIVDARATPGDAGETLLVEVRVKAAPHTPTQPPIAPAYAGERAREFADLPGAWRVGVEPAAADAGARYYWPWRASLAKADLAATYNRANLVLPAAPGESVARIVVPRTAGALRVTLLRDGAEHATREVAVP